MPEDSRRAWLRRGGWLLGLLAAGKLLLNVAFHGRYGYFRDELYYLACSEHLDWGYVDHPPLSIAVLALTRALGGDSLYALRFPAALAGAVVVVLCGRIAAKLGGGSFAQVLAALAAALSPTVLGNAGRSFSMNAFDLLFWAWAAYLVVTLLVEERPKLWLLFGVVAGLGVLNKYSMLFLGFGLVLGLLLTRARGELRRPWPWLGAGIAAALVLPHVLWEAAHAWPSLEFLRNASQDKNVALSPLDFFGEQILQMGLAQAPLWLAGLSWFAVHRKAAKLRPFAWLYPLVFAVMVTNGAKAYYLTPIYFPYLAAGAVWLEAASASGRRAWLRPAGVLALILLSLASLPFAIPCLPVERFIAYSRALGVTPRAEEHQALAELPQYYADQFGWEEFAAEVAAIHAGLTRDEQEHCVIYVRNYGEAAALDFFGRRHGLPPARCAHNSYWLWGPGETEMKVALVLGAERNEAANRADLEGPGRFGRVELAAVIDAPYAMPFERGRQLFLCREPYFSFTDIWEDERFYY